MEVDNMSQMPRETNPPRGFRNGVLPNHEKANGSHVVTGENNPLPVSSYGMTEGGVWIPRKVTDDGHDLTQLSGRNVEEIFFFNAQEIRDTNYHFTNTIDVSKYKEIVYIAENTHDVELEITAQYGIQTFIWDSGSGSFINTNNQSVNVSSQPIGYRHLLNGALPLLDRPAKELRFWVRNRTTAPTSGSITIRAWGVIN